MSIQEETSKLIQYLEDNCADSTDLREAILVAKDQLMIRYFAAANVESTDLLRLREIELAKSGKPRLVPPVAEAAAEAVSLDEVKI